MVKEKARNFTFILYPESCPADFKEKLEMLDRPIAISPLHSLDLNKTEVYKVTGEKYKKPHYHVIYVAANPVTADSVRVKIKRLLGSNAVAIVQIIKTSLENTYAYLTHDSKDAIAKGKHRYDKKDICLLNNFDISRYVTLDVEDKDMYFNLICNLIAENLIPNILQLRQFIMAEGDKYGIDLKLMQKVVAGKSGMLRLFFDGAYQELKKNNEQK